MQGHYNVWAALMLCRETRTDLIIHNKALAFSNYTKSVATMTLFLRKMLAKIKLMTATSLLQ